MVKEPQGEKRPVAGDRRQIDEYMKQPIKTKVGAFALLAALILLALSGHSTTLGLTAAFTVDSSGDQPDADPGDGLCRTASGACTLRAAIDETNALEGPNTIQIPAMTIFLQSELKIENDVSSDAVHIQGAGQEETILDGGGVTRIFMFAPRSGSHSISDLTIQNGNNQNSQEPDWNGGGIYNEAELTLTNLTIRDCRAYRGGGVYNQYAFLGDPELPENIPSLDLQSVTIDANNAYGKTGGGLFNGSRLQGSQVTITGNQAAQSGAGFYNNSDQPASLTDFLIAGNQTLDGAGVNNDLGELTLSRGTISGNTAHCCRPDGSDTGGAGIYNNDGSMTLEEVSIRDNIAESPGGYGGGLYNWKAMTLNQVSVHNNQATLGAGIFNGNLDNQPNQMELTNTTVSANLAESSADVDGEAGGIFNQTQGVLKLYSTTVAGNQAAVSGGISNHSESAVELENTILAGNTDNWGASDCLGNFRSTGHNLIENPTGNPDFNPSLACSFDTQSSDLLYLDPRLGPLEGQPAYLPLRTTSPAVDRGADQDCPDVDQRNAPRPAGASCDIGAFELQYTGTTSPMGRIFIPAALR